MKTRGRTQIQMQAGLFGYKVFRCFLFFVFPAQYTVQHSSLLSSVMELMGLGALVTPPGASAPM